MPRMTFTSPNQALETWRKAEPMITQQELAFAAGVAVRTAHAWCNGESTPTIAQIKLLEAKRPGLVRRLFPEAFPEG
jgi:DNA-binding transcriptional regulator YiaG